MKKGKFGLNRIFTRVLIKRAEKKFALEILQQQARNQSSAQMLLAAELRRLR
jgi:hypothetical protein